jgi:hypothetical protein
VRWGWNGERWFDTELRLGAARVDPDLQLVSFDENRLSLFASAVGADHDPAGPTTTQRARASRADCSPGCCTSWRLGGPQRLTRQVAAIRADDADITALRGSLLLDLPTWRFWRCRPDLHRPPLRS